jgi:hypothetical protein
MEKREDAPSDPLEWDTERGVISLSARPGGSQGLFGTELTMGRRLDALETRHNIVKTAMGSTLLHTHWKPIAGAYPTSGKTLFELWIDHLLTAQATLGGKVAGCVWIQGESDAGNQTAANAYATNLVTLIAEFRRAFPGTWWILNRLHSGSGGNFNSTVRAAQDAAVLQVSDAWIIDGSDLPLSGAHFTGNGYVTLGNRFADAIAGFAYKRHSGTHSRP